MERTKKSGAHQSIIIHLKQTIFFMAIYPGVIESFHSKPQTSTSCCHHRKNQGKTKITRMKLDLNPSKTHRDIFSLTDTPSQHASVCCLLDSTLVIMSKGLSPSEVTTHCCQSPFRCCLVKHKSSDSWLDADSSRGHVTLENFVSCITDVVGFRVWRHKPYPNVWRRLHVTIEKFERFPVWTLCNFRRQWWKLWQLLCHFNIWKTHA